MDNNEVTVDKAIAFLKRISEGGCGDAVIKLQDSILHDDEYTLYNNSDGSKILELRGHIYNLPIQKEIDQFIREFHAASEKLYRLVR